MNEAAQTLIFIPTYNEKENVEPLCAGILALGLDLDILFLDDNSPDGTGRLLDDLAEKHKNVHVIHRSGKLGIGSAHREGIRWAYQHNYPTLITMDSDFTHPPQYIAQLLEHSDGAAVVVGSRYMLPHSLDGWNIYRKTLTKLGHLMTRLFLNLKYDATGALRLYRLDQIPSYAFDLVRSQGYSFLYESLFILNLNQFPIKEIPIRLPARTYGHSKMRFSDAWQSLKLLMILFFHIKTDRQRFELIKPYVPSITDDSLENDQDWESYWGKQKGGGGYVYDLIAAFYRQWIIKRTLNHFVRKHFQKGSKVLHAGCGSGQVDEDIRADVSITAMDYSVNALNIYNRVHRGNCQLLHASLFNIPLPDHSVDGIYNLGVMEHYSEEDVHKILSEFGRILKPDGKIVLFWPPEFGVTVNVLKGVHFICQKILKKNVKMHPDEINRIQSKAHVQTMVEQAHFELVDYYFGPKDLFTQCAVVLAPKKDCIPVVENR